MTNTSEIQVYELHVLYYTKKKAEKVIVDEDDLGEMVIHLMKNGRVQYVYVKRYRGDK